MKELVQKVKQWGIDRGLDKVGHLAQAKYTLKETAELLDAYADSNIEEINDAIGDIFVTLIVGASNDEAIYQSVVEFIEENDHFTKGWINQDDKFGDVYQDLVSQALLLESRCSLGCVDSLVYHYAVNYLADCLDSANSLFNQRLSVHDCLQLAYNEIKNRTGKMVNGQFIKD